MKSIAVLLGFTALAIGGLVHSRPAIAAGDTAGAITEQDVGRDIYVVRCSTCHGVHGRGTKGYELPATGPALQGDKFIIYAPPTAIAAVIRNGRTGAERHFNDTFPDMPSFDASMIEDLRPLIAYLKGDMQKGK